MRKISFRAVIPAFFFRHSRESGNPVRMDPQSEALRFRLRMTRGQSVEDDKRCVIPAQAGIQTGLDPQSSWGRHRATKLRMTACEIAIGDGSIGMTKRRDCRVARLMPRSSQRLQSFRHCETSFVRHCEPAGVAIPPSRHSMT